MAVRVGVDVGGTFTKAVAFDLGPAVVAEAVVPTTHDHPTAWPPASWTCVAELAAQVGAERVELVTHSTTQAVNALLEGDVATVGMVGMGRRPDLRKARKRTELSNGRAERGQAPRDACRSSSTSPTASTRPTAAAARRAAARSAGAEAIAVAEAFAPDDLTNETTGRGDGGRRPAGRPRRPS